MVCPRLINRSRWIDRRLRIGGLTGQVMHGRDGHGFLAGFDAHLTKPVMFEDLQRVLHEVR